LIPSSGNRAYNSVGKGQNGRKGQQSHQSSYFSRGSINANYLGAPHGHGGLIKSYDTTAI